MTKGSPRTVKNLRFTTDALTYATPTDLPEEAKLRQDAMKQVDASDVVQDLQGPLGTYVRNRMLQAK